MALDVSVPCSSCGRGIRFGYEACFACRTQVEPGLKRALEQRLEATSADYRAMRNRIREASILLAVVGLFQILLALFVYFSAPDGNELDTALRISAVVGCSIGAGTLLAARSLERHPIIVISVVFVVWASMHVLLALLNPLTVLDGVLIKLAIAVVLVRGVLAAREAERVKKRLVTEASMLPAG